jgi:large subunit ribosomal protein L25
MKTINLRGYKREGTGKSANNRIRKQGWVPCELYGAGENVHFAAFIADFKDIVYTPETYRVQLDIDGANYDAIMREVQFHPLNEDIIHVDFMRIDEEKQVKLKLPIKFTGVSVGVREGGKLVRKIRALKVKGFPKDMPDAIEVDITNVGLGKSVRVSDVVVSKLEVLNAPANPIATVDVPRGLKGKEDEAAAATKKK